MRRKLRFVTMDSLFLFFPIRRSKRGSIPFRLHSFFIVLIEVKAVNTIDNLGCRSFRHPGYPENGQLFPCR
jgi:hypothetical protein